MKLNLDKEYMKKIKYITLGFVIIYVIYKILEDFPDFFNNIKFGLNYLTDLLSPLIWGIIITLILLPLVQYIENLLGKIRLKKNKQLEISDKGKRIRRLISLILAFSAIILLLVMMVYGTYVMIGGTIKDFSIEDTWQGIKTNAQQYFTVFNNIENSLRKIGISPDFAKAIENYSTVISNNFENFINVLAQSAGSIGKGIVNFFLGFVFAANIIIYREYFSKLFENFLRLTLNKKWKKTVKEILHDIYHVFLGFIRGQVIDLTLLGLVTSVALMIAGYDFAFIVGMIAGYTNVIPYLGSWLGALPVVFVTLASGGLQKAIFGYVYILIVQQIYITFITPRIQGQTVGLHPMFVLLALIVFGSIFGLVGMIFAIPLAGIIKIFINKWVNHKKNKDNIELVQLDEK